MDPEVKLNKYRRDQNIHNSKRRNAFVAVWINVPWTAFSMRLRISVLGLFIKPEHQNPHSYLKINWFIRFCLTHYPAKIQTKLLVYVQWCQILLNIWRPYGLQHSVTCLVRVTVAQCGHSFLWKSKIWYEIIKIETE